MVNVFFLRFSLLRVRSPILMVPVIVTYCNVVFFFGLFRFYLLVPLLSLSKYIYVDNSPVHCQSIRVYIEITVLLIYMCAD